MCVCVCVCDIWAMICSCSHSHTQLCAEDSNLSVCGQDHRYALLPAPSVKLWLYFRKYRQPKFFIILLSNMFQKLYSRQVLPRGSVSSPLLPTFIREKLYPGHSRWIVLGINYNGSIMRELNQKDKCYHHHTMATHRVDLFIWQKQATVSTPRSRAMA